MYGQTEASPRISYVPWKKSSDNKCIGISIPKGKLYLKNMQSDISSNNRKIGELIYKGPNVSLGYSNSYKDLENKNENKYILKTGDLAFKDKNLFFLYGRKKRIIKYFGNRVSLDDIEDKIKKKNIEIACIGNDEGLKIFLTKKNYLKEVFFEITKKMRIQKNFFTIKIIKTIPRFKSGKINYGILKKYEN